MTVASCQPSSCPSVEECWSVSSESGASLKLLVNTAQNMMAVYVCHRLCSESVALHCIDRANLSTVVQKYSKLNSTATDCYLRYHRIVMQIL